MNKRFNRRSASVLALSALTATLVACGGGSSEPDGPIPLYAGTYFVVMNKTVDNCNTGVANRVEILQTVSQSGRSVTLVSNQVVLQGQVDPDNLGISTSAQSVDRGVRLTTGMVYRATDTVGLFGAGLSLVADADGERCVVAYNGQAQLQ